MPRHRSDDTPGWLRAALDAARRPQRPPVGGFVMDGPPRTRASIRRGDALAVPGLQVVRAAMHPAVPRERLPVEGSADVVVDDAPSGEVDVVRSAT